MDNRIDRYLGNTYKLLNSEHFEEYLTFVDVSYLSRKAVCAVSPTASLTKNEDGSYTYSMSTVFRTDAFTFRPDEEFVDERADGAKVRSLVRFEGDEMLQTQTEDNGRVSKHVRTFNPNSLIVTTTVEGWPKTCVRTYRLVN